MNIVRKDIDQNNAVLTLKVEKQDYTEKVEKTLRDYRKKANVPGFRPGMTPMGLLKKMYGRAIMAEEINKVVSDNLYKYISENAINLLGEPLPNMELQQEIDFTAEEFEFHFDLGLAPEFEVEMTKKDKVKYYQLTVTDEMINNQIKSYTGRYGKYVQEEVVEEKDMVKGEILELVAGKVNEDGLKLKDAVLTPAYMKDEAQKALFVGAKKGDVIAFNPQKAFENEAEISSLLKISKDEAKNITADFQFIIEGITRYHEAEVDQELFDKVYGEAAVSSEEEFKAKIVANIQETLTGDSDYKFGMDARDMLVKKYEGLSFPDAFLKRWVLETNKNMTAETLEADYPKMIEDLTWQLVKNKISKANELKVEPEEVKEYAKKIARSQFAQYGMIGVGDDILENYANDMMKKEDTLKNIIDKVAEDKVFNIIKSSVKLENKEISVDEFNKFFEN